MKDRRDLVEYFQGRFGDLGTVIGVAFPDDDCDPQCSVLVRMTKPIESIEIKVVSNPLKG